MTHHENTALRSWRTLGVAGASLAVLALAGVSATQAFADSGHHRDNTPVLATTGSEVIHAGPAASKARGVPSAHHAPRYITVPATKKNASPQGTDGPTVNGLQAFQSAAAGVLPGATVSDLSGMTGDKGGGRGGLQLTLAGGTPSSPVQVTYANAVAGERASFKECQDQVNCDVLTLPDGSLLDVYDVPLAHGLANLAAARLVNGVDVGVWVGVPAGGDHPVVIRQQLADLLSQPVWGHLDHQVG